MVLVYLWRIFYAWTWDFWSRREIEGDYMVARPAGRMAATTYDLMSNDYVGGTTQTEREA